MAQEDRIAASSPEVPALPPVRKFLKEYGRYLFSILFSIILTAALLLLPVDYAAIGNLGYIGVFLTTLLSSATVIFPSPTLAAAWIGGSFLFPPLVGLAAGLGASLGEITGYTAGYGGSALASRSRYYAPIQRFVGRYGLVAIFVFALIPNPLFDVAGLAAGTTRIPLWAFLTACFLGKTVRFIIIAYLGSLKGVGFNFLVGQLLGSQMAAMLGKG